MKHYYPNCPYNPSSHTVRYTKDTSCPWCLQEEILRYEDWYRDSPEYTLFELLEDLE